MLHIQLKEKIYEWIRGTTKLKNMSELTVK